MYKINVKERGMEQYQLRSRQYWLSMVVGSNNHNYTCISYPTSTLVLQTQDNYTKYTLTGDCLGRKDDPS